MLARISWPTATLCSVAIVGGVTLTALHLSPPGWLAGIIVAVAGAIPGILKGGAS